MKTENKISAPLLSPYPDPITPRCDKVLLQNCAYDPFELMPRELPAHPRVFCSAVQLERVRAELETVPWRASALKRLQAECLQDEAMPAAMPAEPDAALNVRWVHQSARHALAFLLTGDERLLQQARERLLGFARAALSWPIKGHVWATKGGLAESHFIKYLGFSYDLLAACGLNGEEDACIRSALEKSISASKGCYHYSCGNHNTWAITGRLSVGLALGDRQSIHDALYGCQCDDHWRYGLIHQLRHDVLADGTHWEGTAGYHMYTLSALSQCARMLENSGVDLWNKPLPQQQQNEGNDDHRWVGPSGEKTMKALFDVPLYMAGSNGDLSLLHDSSLRNLRGLHVWGVVYTMAYDAYHDPAYAALLQRMEIENPPESRKYPELPMVLNTSHGLTDFARIHNAEWGLGYFSYLPDRILGINGMHQQGSTLFPQLGMAIMRAEPENPDGFNAFLRWGPHVAGHMHPAALHLDIVAGNRQLTDAARTGGYNDGAHLTWARTTLAANTVTVDRQSMFPYDFPTQSIWECDKWRDRVSDGSLVSFQPGLTLRAVRAVNRAVYPGVCLDRTVIVQPDYLLDIFAVSSDREHSYDWVMHGVGRVESQAITMPGETGRGYQHLSNIRCLADSSAPRHQTVSFENGDSRLQLLLPGGAQLLLADDPLPKQPGPGGGAAIGENDVAILPRTAVIVRQRISRTYFVSLWTAGKDIDTHLLDHRQLPDGSCEVRLSRHGKTVVWRIAALKDSVQQESVTLAE